MARFLIFFLVFYLIYFLVKNLFLKPFRQGYAQGGESQSGGRGFRNPFQKEGDVTILSKPNKKKMKDDGVGDYVDYEEVKD
jgi:hypothetical protein